MSRKGLVLAAFTLAATAVPAMAGEGKWGGEVFGDVYWFAANHDSTIEDQNGMWIRRINLSYDYKFSDVYSARVRVEAASPGDFSSSTMITFIKDAWLKWANPNHAVLMGLQLTPTFAVIESVWGYRAVEKPPVDLQGLGGSRDLGVGAQGAFGASKRVGYHVLVADGSGTKSETDKGKKAMGSVNVRPNERFVIEGYADYEDRTNDADRTTVQAFAGYQAPKLRAGAQWTKQTRNTVGEDVELTIYSGFVAAQATEKMWVFGRVDRNEDPNPDGEKINYLPFADTAANTFVVAGLDFALWQETNDKGKLIADARLVPNVEAVFYDAPDGGGPTPDDDIVPRLTFVMHF
jgi:hypothetical protein